MHELVPQVQRAMLAMQRRAWEQGIAAQALLELGDVATMIVLAKAAAMSQHPDGRLALIDEPAVVTDPAANGEAVLTAARLTKDPFLQAAADKMAAYLLYTAPRLTNGVLSHLTTTSQVWVDSMYMAPPFLALAGFPAEAWLQISGMRAYLWQPEARLFAHVWDEPTKTLARPDFWGVGNGWALAGITRVVSALPAAWQDERATLIHLLNETIASCLTYQRDDGLFHNILDQPGTFVEVNFAQMLAYSIYRGVAAGFVAPHYLASADTMRQAAHARVDAYGLVQGVCGAPNFDRPGIATEGQAFFLLMEAAYAAMRKS